MKLWIDDIRPMPEQYDIHVKSVKVARCVILKFWNDLELISLDHDAGDYAVDGGDYINIIDWLDELYHVYGIEIPFAFDFHTSNVVGRENMQRIVEKNGWKMV